MNIQWNAVEAIATCSLVLTGIAAIIFAYTQLRRERDARRVENLERQMETFESELFRRKRTQLANDRIEEGRLRVLKNDDAPNSLYEVLNFYEHVALLAKRGRIDIYDIWHSLGFWIFPIYYDARRVIDYEQSTDKSFYVDLCWLVGKLQRIQRKETNASEVWSDEELVNFYKDEQEALTGQPPRRRRTRKASTSAASGQAE